MGRLGLSRDTFTFTTENKLHFMKSAMCPVITANLQLRKTHAFPPPPEIHVDT
jgi:hypothetical protein